MHAQDLEDNTASLSRDEISKILKDLAVHPDTEKSIMAALESSQACPKDTTSSLNANADRCHQSSQPHASDRKNPTRHSFLSRVLERIRRELHRETAPKTKPSDVQVCDNCHKLFRISTAKNDYKGCWGHPGMSILYTSRPWSSNSCKKYALITCSGIVQASWKTFERWSGMNIGSNK